MSQNVKVDVPCDTRLYANVTMSDGYYINLTIKVKMCMGDQCLYKTQRANS